ncbi:MAG TPA: YbgF trimerization domain-containing protein [Candidatus Acidoferrum sp.]|nr:YbgF trimerization domain-containing protein [Candidatus Acidoferrum sp.]
MQIRHCLVLVLVLGAVNTAWAQVQVRDANSSRNSGSQPAPANNDLMISIYDQLQALQQEVQTLRGIVEEQGYQLKRLQAEQRDRYLDIDRRLGALNNPSAKGSATSQVAPAALPPPSLDSSSAALNSASTVSTLPAPPPASLTASTGNKKASTSADNDIDEQELYRKALNLLLEDHKAEETKPRAQESVTLFQTYIDNYPKGRLLTNALYWQGAGYLLVGNPNRAKEVLTRLVTEFPQDAKAAGAMLKLGEAYKQLGDKAHAAEVWKGIRARFPEAADENGKADEFLKTL